APGVEIVAPEQRSVLRRQHRVHVPVVHPVPALGSPVLPRDQLLVLLEQVLHFLPIFGFAHSSSPAISGHPVSARTCIPQTPGFFANLSSRSITSKQVRLL